MTELREKVARAMFESLAPSTSWEDGISDFQRGNWLRGADAILALPEIAEALEAKRYETDAAAEFDRRMGATEPKGPWDERHDRDGW